MTIMKELMDVPEDLDSSNVANPTILKYEFKLNDDGSINGTCDVDDEAPTFILWQCLQFLVFLTMKELNADIRKVTLPVSIKPEEDDS